MLLSLLFTASDTTYFPPCLNQTCDSCRQWRRAIICPALPPNNSNYATFAISSENNPPCAMRATCCLAWEGCTSSSCIVVVVGGGGRRLPSRLPATTTCSVASIKQATWDLRVALEYCRTTLYRNARTVLIIYYNTNGHYIPGQSGTPRAVSDLPCRDLDGIFQGQHIPGLMIIHHLQKTSLRYRVGVVRSAWSTYARSTFFLGLDM